ncbi:MAG: pteridine reductase [Gammaproteobacteria bacterium]|nr:pteridine reductase [Gammaproteobacteria bacterium]NND59004.1 pteridine reductase [Gammaproteobacteria bacterium]
MSSEVVLVTGGARRIGAAISGHLHAAGMTVVIHYHRSHDDAVALARELAARRPGSADVRQADLRDNATLAPLIESITDQYGRLDGLINNASTFYPTPLGEITESAWDDLVGTNLRAPTFLSQAAAAALRASEGAIVNLVDIHGWRPLAGFPVYSTAKAGLDMLTRALARELGPEVRVNGVAPGPILWPETDGVEQTKQQIIAATALQRAGDPIDVAKTVLFLLRDATYITGQVIAVDGGRSI